MINHARTLLLNESGRNQVMSGVLEEFIDPTFGPLTLSPALQRVHRVLFSEVADAAYKNVLLHSLMTVLHSTEFAEYVTKLDARITYLGHQSIASVKSTAKVAAQGMTLSGNGNVVGVPECTVANPRMEWLWYVTVQSGSSPFTVNVRWEQGRVEQNFQVTFAAGQSDLIPLIGQPDLFFQVRNAMLSGDSWAVSVLAMPTLELAALVASFEKLGASTLGELFGRNEAPYVEFEKLWSRHPYINYRLSGIVLALIYRLEEIRTRG